MNLSEIKGALTNAVPMIKQVGTNAGHAVTDVVTPQQVNHMAQMGGFATLTWITDNVFQIVGAVGVLVNIYFVVRSYHQKKRQSEEEIRLMQERHRMEEEAHKAKMQAFHDNDGA